MSLARRPIVYANGTDRQSGMSLPMPNLSEFKQLVWPIFMLSIKFFLTDNYFPTISSLEKSIVDKISETFKLQKSVPVGKPICEPSQLTVSIEDLKFGNNIW